MVAEGPDGPVTFAFRVVGVEDCGGGIESALPCTADRQARRQHPQGGSISGTSLLESSTAAAAMAESAAVRARSLWLRDRACAKCDNRRQTTDDRRLSAERLNDRRRSRHRRHFDEQRERARRRPAVAGRAEPGLNRPRRRSRPGGPNGGRPAVIRTTSSILFNLVATHVCLVELLLGGVALSCLVSASGAHHRA